MANYIVRECTSETTYIVSADTLNIDDVISFYFGEDINCGVVVNETSDSHDSLFYRTEIDCCDCLTANTGNSSFAFERCDNQEYIYITIQTFCDTYGDTPISKTVWNLFNLDTNENVCATFMYPDKEPGVSYWIPDEGPFNGCGNCDIGIPRSANTETFFCEQICTESGTTVVEVVVPHPVWTGLYGESITQNNSVQLGGRNGLNM
jgi:hypothetical protein